MKICCNGMKFHDFVVKFSTYLILFIEMKLKFLLHKSFSLNVYLVIITVAPPLLGKGLPALFSAVSGPGLACRDVCT